jgi:hypothetical protein
VKVGQVVAAYAAVRLLNAGTGQPQSSPVEEARIWDYMSGCKILGQTFSLTSAIAHGR